MNYTIQLFDVMSQLHSIQDLVIAEIPFLDFSSWSDPMRDCHFSPIIAQPSYKFSSDKHPVKLVLKLK